MTSWSTQLDGVQDLRHAVRGALEAGVDAREDVAAVGARRDHGLHAGLGPLLEHPRAGLGGLVPVAHLVGEAAAAAVLEEADGEAGLLEQADLRAHRLPQALLERVLAARVEDDVDGLGGRVLQAEPFGPGVAVGRGLRALAGERRPRALDERAVGVGHAVHLDEVGAELAQREDRLHVVAAQLAGHVAVAAELAAEGDVDELVGRLAAPVHQAERGDQLAAARVGVELARFDGGAALGEAVAPHEVEGDPLAVAAAGAAHRVGAVVGEGHRQASFAASAGGAVGAPKQSLPGFRTPAGSKIALTLRRASLRGGVAVVDGLRPRAVGPAEVGAGGDEIGGQVVGEVASCPPAVAASEGVVGQAELDVMRHALVLRLDVDADGVGG